ncbi:MAG TPA: ATP-binding protein [Steroidobacteraceae bacterium]|nr:ATP-binding protein [Steroidobacteraceae bacterium]
MAKAETSLLRWVWRTYVRNALIPLLVVELLLVAVYLTSHAWSLRRNVAALSDVAEQELSRIASDQSAVIEQKLGQVAALTELLRRQTTAALAGPVPRPRDRQRLRRQPSGALTTWSDDGGAAVYWSALTAKGPAEFERLERLATVDSLLRDVTLANPLIVQAYLNTHDSLNRIWPWIDTASVYDPGMNIPDFNFYYEADARNNPTRAVVWTDAYVDPAGKGWLVSAIAPAYRGDFLEAVVGADVTIDRIVDDVLAEDIPWQGFLLLIGKSGTLLALPPEGEQLFELRELRAHEYVNAIRADTFKPEEFNVYRRPDLAEIGALLKAQPSGSGRLDGPSPHLVAWETIPSAGWKLMSIVPEQAVFGPSRTLNSDLAAVGWVMLAGLAGFYAIFFTFLYRRARVVSHRIAEPLRQIERMAHRIAVGDYEQVSPEFGVSEFRHTVGELQRMGRLLGDSNRARENAEARLTERNEELSTILSLSPDGLVSFDAAGLVTETNPAFLALTGWTRDGLIGLSRSAFWSRLADLGGTGHAGEAQPGSAAVLRLQRPRPAVLECRVVGARSGAQVAYFRDVTRADELDRAKSRFVATAAHELRTPIAVITGYAEYLQSSDPPPSQRGEILATMRRHGDQIAGIVSELLDLARIEARAGRDFTMIRQPLAPAVRRYIDSFRIGEYARVPSLEGEIGDAEAFVDADKFCQALSNVVANACKYSPPGAPIVVRLVADAGEIGVCVQDRGEGMDEETQRRIFEQFYRAENASGVAGTGLGMSIVKEIMDIHGGRIEIESVPGRGTAVTLWLPRAGLRG